MLNLSHPLLKKNQLYKNSLYLILSNSSASLLGFLFWVIISSKYSSVEVGQATSIFSLANLIATLSILGLNTGIMRHLAVKDSRNEKINSSLVITVTITIILAVLSVWNLNLILEPLVFIKGNSLYILLFLILCVTNTLNSMYESIFISLRDSSQVLAKTLIQNVARLIFPFLFFYIGSLGIAAYTAAGIFMAIVYEYFVLRNSYRIKFNILIDIQSVKKMWKISFGTYLSTLFNSLPAFLIPIFIIQKLGPSQTAFYYMAATTANFLFMIPQVISQNLLVEGSHDYDKLIVHVKRSIFLAFAVLFPGILIMLFYGNNILIIFGKQYSIEGLLLLKYLSISGVFVGINYILGTVLAVYGYIKQLATVSLFGCITLSALSYIFLNFGIVGVGYATIVTQFLLFLIYVLLLYTLRKTRFV